MPFSVPLGGCAHPCCVGAPCGCLDTHPDCLQGVVQFFPLLRLLVFCVEAFIVDTEVEIDLHEAKVIVLVVQAQLVETCREKWGLLFLSRRAAARQTCPQRPTLILPIREGGVIRPINSLGSAVWLDRLGVAVPACLQLAGGLGRDRGSGDLSPLRGS